MTKLENVTVLVTPRSFGAYDPALRAELEAKVGRVRYNETGRALTAEELRAQIGDVDGLLAGVDEIDASVLEAGQRLRVISRYGVGTSNVDLRAARERGVTVTYTPGANADAVAELAIGFLFALSRSLPRADRAVQGGHWPNVSGIQVTGRTVGVLGLGKIGRQLAWRAAALGCAVIAHDPYVTDAGGVTLASFDEVVGGADFLSLHLPLTTLTRGIIDRDVFNRMRRGSFVLNTARGELVVEEDLLAALDDGQIGGAALDTLAVEPPAPDNPLLHRPDVLITPHLGAHTQEATNAMGRLALDDLLAVLSGRPPRHPVQPEEGVAHVR